MSPRVYLFQDPDPTTQEEETPVGLRIPLSHATVTALQSGLQQAYRRDALRLVRRTTVLLDLRVHHGPVERRCCPWGLSPACLSGWRQACLLRGLHSLVYRPGGGRRPKLPAKQKKRLVERSEAGPLVGGCETAPWHSVLLRGLIWRECGVLSNRPSGWTWLHNLGGACHKARVVSAPLDTARRQAWRQDAGPTLRRAAKRRRGGMLLEDEASLAQWGSLRSTWARRGQPPEVPTSGKRKGYNGCGALEYFAGRLGSQGLVGRWNSERSHAFWPRIMAQTTPHRLWSHDGAR
jgi:transposase